MGHDCHWQLCSYLILQVLHSHPGEEVRSDHWMFCDLECFGKRLCDHGLRKKAKYDYRCTWTLALCTNTWSLLSEVQNLFWQALEVAES